MSPPVESSWSGSWYPPLYSIKFKESLATSQVALDTIDAKVGLLWEQLVDLMAAWQVAFPFFCLPHPLSIQSLRVFFHSWRMSLRRFISRQTKLQSMLGPAIRPSWSALII